MTVGISKSGSEFVSVSFLTPKMILHSAGARFPSDNLQGVITAAGHGAVRGMPLKGLDCRD